MIFTKIKRIIRTGFVSFWRNGFLSFAAIIVVTLSLLALAGMIFAGAFGRSILSTVKEQVDINVYFALSASESAILELQQSIDSLPEVASTEYVSREEALALFQEKWKDNSLIIQGLQELGSNPFPASLNIKAQEPGQYGGIARYLDGRELTNTDGTPLIDKVNYEENKLIIDRLSRIIPAVEGAGAVLAGILVIVAVIVVFNTIRLITYTMRDEMAVMKLVGASNTFIRGPLVVSGIMYGIASGALTLMVMAAFAYWTDTVILRLAGVEMAANFELTVNILSRYFSDNFRQLFIIIMGAGIALGGLSSYIAARRYLKV